MQKMNKKRGMIALGVIVVLGLIAILTDGVILS